MEEDKPTRGQIGVYRRSVGIMLAIIAGIISLLDAFSCYEGSYDMVKALLIASCVMLISGISKDLVSIYKGRNDKT